MKVKVMELVEGCFPVRTNGSKSDCFDLFLAEDITLKKGQVAMVDLGVAIELPKGMVAKIYNRSSAPVKLGISIPNGLGFIDNSYKGENDEWKGIMQALKAVTLNKGTRAFQFEIVPSQFATRWQKLRWLLSSKVKLVRVQKLSSSDRGGIGSSGK